jgi:divalent metal cation (Fe/Co/Zn/Cd) transporter
LLYAFAGHVVLTPIFSLAGKRLKPESSLVGICLLLAAALIVLILGTAKRRLAKATGKGAIWVDATQSNIRAYMSWIALGGLFLNATLRIPWDRLNRGALFSSSHSSGSL